MVQNSISEESCSQREASAKEDAETTSALPSSYICLRAKPGCRESAYATAVCASAATAGKEGKPITCLAGIIKIKNK